MTPGSRCRLDEGADGQGQKLIRSIAHNDVFRATSMKRSQPLFSWTARHANVSDASSAGSGFLALRFGYSRPKLALPERHSFTNVPQPWQSEPAHTVTVVAVSAFFHSAARYDS